MTDNELKELVASLAIDQKELTKKMTQTEEQMKAVKFTLLLGYAFLLTQKQLTQPTKYLIENKDITP